MSKRRLIPKLQLKQSERFNGKLVLVITKQFNSFVEVGDPLSQAKIFQDQGADELIFVNIDRNNQSVELLANVMNRVSEEIFMPITVGGGVKSLEDFRLLLLNGADKVSINSQAVENPSFVTQASEKYGAQCVVVSIDYKLDSNTGKFKVWTKNGQNKTPRCPIEWALECEKRGAGELLLTCIDNDGLKNGLELTVAAEIARKCTIPVILSGGCGLAKHFCDGFLIAKADAVSAGSFFAHRDQNFMQTRSQIKNSGVNIRVFT